MKKYGVKLSKNTPNVTTNTLVIGDEYNIIDNFLYPNLIEIINNNVEDIYIIDDENALMYNKVANLAKAQGFNVLYFNPFDLENTMRISRDDLLTSPDAAIELADILLGEIVNKEKTSKDIKIIRISDILRAFLEFFLLYLYENKDEYNYKGLCGIIYCIDDYLKEPYIYDNEYCRLLRYKPESKYIELYEILNKISKVTIEYSLNILKDKLAAYMNDNIAYLTSGACRNNVSLKSKTLIFICRNEYKENYDFWCRLVMSMFVNKQLSEIKYSNHCVPSNIILHNEKLSSYWKGGRQIYYSWVGKVSDCNKDISIINTHNNHLLFRTLNNSDTILNDLYREMKNFVILPYKIIGKDVNYVVREGLEAMECCRYFDFDEHPDKVTPEDGEAVVFIGKETSSLIIDKQLVGETNGG